MKLKKILLFILIFLSFLVITNNSEAYVISEGGVGKYYLSDLPISSDDINSLFFVNNDKTEILLIQFPDNYLLGFDRFDNIFVLYNEDGTEVAEGFPDLLSFYSCSIELFEDKYIGSVWYPYSKGNTHGIPANFLYYNYNFIYGNDKLYPCKNDYGIVINLPNGINWSDNYILYGGDNGVIYLAHVIPITDSSNWYKLKGDLSYRIFNSTTYSGTHKEVIRYIYDFTNDSWSFDSRITDVSGHFANYMVGIGFDYGVGIKFDILNSNSPILNDSEEILMPNPNCIFKNLYSYSNFPYILNNEEDLAKGNEDIIIMPRRFFK